MKIKHLFAVTLGMLLATSCSNELPVGQSSDSLFDEIPEGMFEYRFALKGLTPTRLSYATVDMETDEMNIFTSKVVVFGQATAGTLADGDKLVCVQDGKIKNGEVTFQITGSTNFQGGVKAAVYLISNEGNSNFADLELIPGTTTHKEFVDQLQSKGDAGADIKTKGLLQIGKTLDNKVPSAGQKLSVGSLTTQRPFARFDVKNEGMKALSITKLEVKDISDKFFVLTETFPSDAIHTHKKTVVVADGLNRPEDGSKPDPKLVPGVLYSYPGSATGDDSPVLLVTGKLTTGAGKDTLLTDFEVPFAKGNAKLRIKTNKRYTLTLKATIDGIIADITESFAPWGSEADANMSFEIDLDLNPTVAKIGTGLTLESVAADGTLNFNGTTGQESYNFSVENVAEGTTVAALVDGEAQTVETVSTYGTITHYVVKLTEKVKTTEKKQTITITGVAAEAINFSLAIKHTGSKVVEEEKMTYPLAMGYGNVDAVKVGDLWWAPVNVGATGLEAYGALYQYGRNYSWSSAEAILKNNSFLEEQVNLDRMEDMDNSIAYVASRDMLSIDYWFTTDSKKIFDDKIAPGWAAVGNGNNNPCPNGWRIPTDAEFAALLTSDVIETAEFGNQTATVTVGAKKTSLTFQYGGGYFNSTYEQRSNSVRAKGVFWTKYENEINPAPFHFVSDTKTIARSVEPLSLAHCCYLRCVRDAV